MALTTLVSKWIFVTSINLHSAQQNQSFAIVKHLQLVQLCPALWCWRSPFCWAMAILRKPTQKNPWHMISSNVTRVQFLSKEAVKSPKDIGTVQLGFPEMNTLAFTIVHWASPQSAKKKGITFPWNRCMCSLCRAPSGSKYAIYSRPNLWKSSITSYLHKFWGDASLIT